MEIIPKSGKVMIEFINDKTSTLIEPESVKKKNQKRRRWGKVIMSSRPLPEEEEINVGDIVCFSTAGIKMIEDSDMAIIDRDKIMLVYGNK